MNDLDHDPHLGPALRDRLRSELPDLEHLATASLAAGTRIRRRRRIGATAGAVAGVAVIALASSQLGGGTGRTAEDPGYADSPSASSDPNLAVGQVLDLGRGLTGTVGKDTAGTYAIGSSTLPGPGTGLVIVVDGPTTVIDEWWSEGFDTLTEDWPGITVAVPTATARALGLLGKVDRVPVTVGAGWTCEWSLADDKANCLDGDGGVAGLVIRDAADRDAWINNSDKGADPSVFTTEAHGDIFISVQGGQDTTNAEIRELGESLTWVD